MARRLGAFPSSSNGGERRYPWNEWTDGSTWEIRHGEDYEVKTENMRVNLHMRAGALSRKVRTRKIVDADGEGLIFQFLDGEAGVGPNSPEQTDLGGAAAMELLMADLREIYERARREVTIPRGDGTRQKYAAVRYKQQIEAAYVDGRLIEAVTRILRKETQGFGHLAAAGRIDLMLESLVVDAGKPYHRFFPPMIVQAARERLDRLRRGEAEGRAGLA